MARAKKKSAKEGRTNGIAKGSLARGSLSKGISATRDELSIADLLTRLLDTGAVVDAHLVLGIADIDLVYVQLKALLCSYDRAVETRADGASAYQNFKRDQSGINPARGNPFDGDNGGGGYVEDGSPKEATGEEM